MDSPGHPRALIEDNLKDLSRVNWLLGGIWLTLKPLARLVSRLRVNERLIVLDVATGGSDIPRAIAVWAARQARPLLCVATDFSLEVLVAGRDAAPVPPSIVFVVADATALPFTSRSFHVALSSLALHHLLPHQAAKSLREQRRCANLGVIVNDIVRSWLTLGGAYLATRLGSRNMLTWHDGPLSVRRAYTVDEMRALAREAGLLPVSLDRFLFYRVALTAVSASEDASGGRAIRVR